MKTAMLFLFGISTLVFAQQYGGERSQQALNPEISVLGDVYGMYDDVSGESEAVLHEVELAIQSALDPYTLFKVCIGVHQAEEEEEGLRHEHSDEYHWHLEEGYVTWLAPLPGLSLDVGKFKQPFGVYNRWHAHALPVLEYPLYIRKLFSDEGLASTGLSANTLFQGLGTSEFTLQAVSHGGENAALAHYKSYWDLTPEVYLEGGLSYFSREPDAYGADLTLLYEPTARAKYSHVQFHAEWGRRDEAQGLFTLLEKRFSAKFLAGLSYEQAEELLDPARDTTAWGGVLTYWQSEYVRLRLHLIEESLSWTDQKSRRAVLQLSVAAGPHKHEEY
jgi:hypothetical protein